MDSDPGILRVTLLATLACLTLASCGGDDPALCEADYTAISAIQGSGSVSPSVGQQAVVRGIVTARYLADDEALAGFFLQSPTGDDDPATSDALFVASTETPEIGDDVAVSGTVAELGEAPASVTALVEGRVAACGRGDSPAPVASGFPADLEPLENMLVSLAPEFTIVGAYNLGRRGQLRAASGGAVWQPTEIAMPGDDARAIAASNLRRTLVIDDGDHTEFPGRIPYLPSEVSLKTLPRAGDRVSGLVGVLDRRGEDRLHALRPLTPESKVREPRFSPPAGSINLAGLNVLNYFNGDGLGGGFPTPRGADSAVELERQEAKLVATILGLGLPDIISLQELENDGFGPQSAIAQLTAAINARIRAPRSTYAFVAAPGAQLGADEITVGLLYRRDKVRPLGAAVTLASEPFQELSRQPLAQAFESVRSSDRITVAALHLKSKGCRNSEGANTDQGDGQGCYNAARLRAVEELLAWVDQDPTGTGIEDWVLVGDFNAYRREDPLRRLEEAGWENLVGRFQPEGSYSFVFRGAAGSLDHAFASPSLAPHARGARVWHINAAYPAWLDYNVEGKPGDLDHALYKASAVRASDHDPLVVSFR